MHIPSLNRSLCSLFGGPASGICSSFGDSTDLSPAAVYMHKAFLGSFALFFSVCPSVCPILLNAVSQEHLGTGLIVLIQTNSVIIFFSNPDVSSSCLISRDSSSPKSSKYVKHGCFVPRTTRLCGLHCDAQTALKPLGFARNAPSLTNGSNVPIT